jgi:hypothetical protein
MRLVRKYTKRKAQPLRSNMREKVCTPISGVVCWDRQIREKHADRLNSLVQVVVEMRNFSMGGKDAQHEGIQMQCRPVSSEFAEKGSVAHLNRFSRISFPMRARLAVRMVSSAMASHKLTSPWSPHLSKNSTVCEKRHSFM